MRPLTVRLLVSATAVAIAGGASALVVADPKPQAAPLHPPLAAAASQSPLVIPASCTGGKQASAAVQQEYATWQATPAEQRAQYLASLPAARRLQLESYIRQRSSSGGGACAAASGGGLQVGAVNVTGSGADIGTYVS
jgi:hypothetical protein